MFHRTVTALLGVYVTIAAKPYYSYIFQALFTAQGKQLQKFQPIIVLELQCLAVGTTHNAEIWLKMFTMDWQIN